MPRLAFGQGALLPDIPPQFLNASGVVASAAKLCSTVTNSNTNLATYSDYLLTTPLPNPITLNALGQPQTGSGSSTAIYIQGRDYRFTLYAPGTGNTCNGVAVGAQIWQRDHVFDLALLPTFDNIGLCDRYPGANMGAKIAACIAALPSSGGVADARGFQGAQSITSTISVTVPVKLLICGATISVSASTAFSSTSAFTVEGCGTGQTEFTQTLNTSTVFAHSSASSFKLRDITFNGAPQISGSAITIDSPSDSNEGSIIENSEFSNQYDAVNLAAAAVFNVSQNNFHGIQHRGIIVANRFNQDQTTGTVTNNLFSCSSPTGHAALEHKTGGGLRFISNEILECDRGYYMNWSSNGGSSQLNVIGNLFDTNTVSGVEIGEAVGFTTGTFTNAIISDNYFNSDATRPGVGILVSSTTSALLIGPIITDNWIEGADAAGVYAIDFVGTSGILANIAGNTIHGQTNSGIRLGPGLSQMHVGINNVRVGSGVGYTFTTTPVDDYLPTRLFVGAPNDSLSLTEQLLLPNAQYLAGRNAAGNAQQKLIGEDASNIVQIAKDGQTVNVGGGTSVSTTSLTSPNFGTTANCSDPSSPSVCGASAAGSANITAGNSAVQVQTSKVTANSQIILTYDQSLGSKLGVTCNTGAASGGLYITARGAGAFNVGTANNLAAVTNPICFSWFLINLVILPPWIFKRYVLPRIR